MEHFVYRSVLPLLIKYPVKTVHGSSVLYVTERLQVPNKYIQMKHKNLHKKRSRKELLDGRNHEQPHQFFPTIVSELPQRSFRVKFPPNRPVAFPKATNALLVFYLCLLEVKFNVRTMKNYFRLVQHMCGSSHPLIEEDDGGSLWIWSSSSRPGVFICSFFVVYL